MPFKLGTEGQPDYYAYELALAAHKVVTEVTPVRPGQQVVITADTASDPRVVQATALGAIWPSWGSVPTSMHLTRTTSWKRRRFGERCTWPSVITPTWGGTVSADLHEDFVLPHPDLYLDGEIVMRGGELVGFRQHFA